VAVETCATLVGGAIVSIDCSDPRFMAHAVTPITTTKTALMAIAAANDRRCLGSRGRNGVVGGG
jgi:hypothetical protein